VQRVLVCGVESGHLFSVIFRIFCRRRKGVGFVVTTHTVWSLEREREREFEEAGGGRARCLLEQERREIVTGRAWGETVMEVEGFEKRQEYG